MDRQKPGVTKSQPGFIDFVVRPLFETWVACFPESRFLLDRINANYEYWQVSMPYLSVQCRQRSTRGHRSSLVVCPLPAAAARAL